MGITLSELLVCLLLLQVRGLCFSAGYHRLLAHGSFKAGRLLRFLLAAGGCTSLRGGPLWYVALHRHHHTHSDTADDVHTPVKGFWWSYGGWLLSGRFATTDYNRTRDLARVPELRWLNRNWLVPPLLLAVLIYCVGGWKLFLVGFCLSSVLLLHIAAALDALVHSVGSQRYRTGEESRNSFVLALLGLGEGWHNNHHHYPLSARHGFFWWEIDGTYTLIRCLAWAGLAWDVRTVPEVVRDRNRLLPDEPDISRAGEATP